MTSNLSHQVEPDDRDKEALARPNHLEQIVLSLQQLLAYPLAIFFFLLLILDNAICQIINPLNLSRAFIPVSGTSQCLKRRITTLYRLSAKLIRRGLSRKVRRVLMIAFDLLTGITGKHERQERLNEKLSRKNPERIQKQIDDLKKITSSGGKLTHHEEQTLEGLEKELKAVKKAREALGDKAPTFSRGWNRDHDSGSGVLGKRRRGSNDATTSDEEVPDDVKSIPMPRDTPPPIPKEVMDKWYAERRARRAAENPTRPDGENKQQKKEAPVAEAKTVYEAKPVVRDLRKEAVSAFVPTAVKMKMNKGQGQGGLIEPEEADRLEQEGYLKTGDRNAEARPDQGQSSRHVTMEDVEDEEA